MSVEYRKLVSLKFGKKFYALLSLHGKSGHVLSRAFKTATSALEYGRRVEARYERLKKAGINEA